MFFVLYFLFSAKLENRRVKQVLPSREGWHLWEEGGGRERGRRVNTVQKICVHMYVNAKMIPVETIS
jgi:hypothetical protein